MPTRRWFQRSAWAFAAFLAAQPARAIVFQSTTAQGVGLGAGNAALDGEAELVVSLGNGTAVGCSGSLVGGGSYILTAAHCVTGDTDTTSATSISINFANVGLNTSSTSYIVNPTWNGTLTHGGDLALIKLSAPVTSIPSYTLGLASSAVGDVVTVAGYGDTGVGSTGYVAYTFGTLYYGRNQYIGVFTDDPTVYGYGFTLGGGTIGSDQVMIAPGDSGGGSFINVNGALELVGVHDFIACETDGCTPDSQFGQYGGDTSVYADAAFLDSVLSAPEPGSFLIVGTGLSGLAAIRRMKQPRLRKA